MHLQSMLRYPQPHLLITLYLQELPVPASYAVHVLWRPAASRQMGHSCLTLALLIKRGAAYLSHFVQVQQREGADLYI